MSPGPKPAAPAVGVRGGYVLNNPPPSPAPAAAAAGGAAAENRTLADLLTRPGFAAALSTTMPVTSDDLPGFRESRGPPSAAAAAPPSAAAGAGLRSCFCC